MKLEPTTDRVRAFAPTHLQVFMGGVELGRGFDLQSVRCALDERKPEYVIKSGPSYLCQSSVEHTSPWWSSVQKEAIRFETRRLAQDCVQALIGRYGMGPRIVKLVPKRTVH